MKRSTKSTKTTNVLDLFNLPILLISFIISKWKLMNQHKANKELFSYHKTLFSHQTISAHKLNSEHTQSYGDNVSENLH